MVYLFILYANLIDAGTKAPKGGSHGAFLTDRSAGKVSTPTNLTCVSGLWEETGEGSFPFRTKKDKLLHRFY